jgi:hypothetical protein
MAETKEALEVSVWDDPDETGPCADCGDDIEVGDKFCHEPLEEGSKYRVYVHDWCAVKNGYPIRSAVDG